ncbi:MAG: transcriptional repressor LexA [Armatimonadota bacterium]|jgi:repressor LexA|nr:transcriptional repressor LexA [candidate division WS1 bacterium]
MDPLSGRRKDVLQAIREHIAEKGFPPSVREIGERTGLRSSCTVQRHIEVLIEKGYLRRDGSKARTLEVVGDSVPSRQGRAVPVVGLVAAGAPILAEQDIEGYITIGEDLLGDEDTFAVKVRGQSMIGAGLDDGDTLVVRRQAHAEDGDIVVALVDGEEATVKRFFRDDGRVRLQPENPTMEALYPDEVAILGKAIVCIKQLEPRHPTR